MTDVIVEGSYASAPVATPVVAGDPTTARCLALHRVVWAESYIGLDGRYVLSRFEAPDAESVRLALRAVGARVDALWPGRIDGSPLADANVVIERRFPESVSAARLRMIDERLRATYPDARLLRRILSLDHTRGVWLFRARRAEAIVAAAPPFLVWACRQVDGRQTTICDAVPKLHGAYES